MHHLLRFIPDDYAERTYFEPFLGGGSLFFALETKRAVLGDLNLRLIHTMQAVRDASTRVIPELELHRTLSSEEHYYGQRTLFNLHPDLRPEPIQAARFIYLNRVCFNGIYRVNTKGDFNVPYGHKDAKYVPGANEVAAVADRLRVAELVHSSFLSTVSRARAGDLVYLDPPYPPLTSTAYFTHYTPDRFALDLQDEVACCFEELTRRGCLVILSNADTGLIRRLYDGAFFSSIPVTRNISCKKEKLQANEVIITNYRVES